MKTKMSILAISVLLAGTSLCALEPSDYEMDIPSPDKSAKYVKHTDAYGDSYYSHSFKNAGPGILKAAHTYNRNHTAASNEVTEGFKTSLDAIRQMRNGETERAKKNLALAIDSFDSALKSNPDLKMVSVANEIDVDEIDMTTDQITEITKLAKIELSKNHVQNARDLLLPLRDEMKISTQYLPMQIYPQSAKTALHELSAGDRTKAVQTMSSALTAIVSEETLIPIPLLDAQEQIETAMKLEGSRKGEAEKMVAAAKNNLAKTVALGYLDENSQEYTRLLDQIVSIEHAAAGEPKLQKLYDSVKASFDHAIHKVQSEAHKLISDIHSS